MPRCAATFDENSVPPWTRGTSGGFECGNKPTPALRDRCRSRHPSNGGDFQGVIATTPCLLIIQF